MLSYDCASIAVEGLYLGDNPLHRDHLWKHFSLNISDILSSFYCFDTSALLTREIITVFIYPSLLMVGLRQLKYVTRKKHLWLCLRYSITGWRRHNDFV